MEDITNIYFADLQGFTVDGKFYLKELSILECTISRPCGSAEIEDAQDKRHHHHIFKPPFEWKKLEVEDRKRALWLKCFHHGFSWNDGDTEYSEIETTINTILKNKPGNVEVYVKGGRKVEWFHYFTRGKFVCTNIENIGCCANLRVLVGDEALERSHCQSHDKSLLCAQQIVDSMHYWLHVLH